MLKQAVALLVHQNAEQVNRLISRLETQFDIYIHIDKKSTLNPGDLHCNNVWKEVAVKWGGFGMVSATTFLYEKILAANVQYSHIILLSGDTLPVKSPEHIAQFLTKHQGVSFLENNPAGELTLERRRLIWYNADFRVEIKGLKRLLYPFIFIRALQRRFRIYRNTKGFERTGSQWTILAVQHVRHLLENCNFQAYKTVAVPDESFVQDHFFNKGLPHNQNLIYANWGNPRGYSPQFIEYPLFCELVKGDYLFARKFKADADYDAEACESDKASSR